jgi:ABC-type lipoprotein export system ATPase subunit
MTATTTVDAGAFVALTGASGSGKSTLLHMIGAIERPDSGTIIASGGDQDRGCDGQSEVGPWDRDAADTRVTPLAAP